MAERKGKYGGLLSEIRGEQALPLAVFPTLLPENRPIYSGKRS